MIVVVGLAFEARIAAGAGIRVICSGDGRNLPDALEASIALGRCGLVSFGVAGGLASELRPGSCIVASEVLDGERRLPTHYAWSQRLLRMHPGAVYGALVGVSAPVAEPAHKRTLHRKTGGVAVDTESHIVARAAAAHGLPMVAIRVVTDPAHRVLPQAALVGVRPDGTTNVAAVLRSLLRRPHDIPALVRVALDTRVARSELLRGRQLLGPPSLGISDLSQLELDVA
ncbi:MAG TPA: adenosylhopane nucleosidase [Xanthobacteraceae bacterium]|nr:adenosylhopane nucleosidase [Xanthobacteraceae bacterium]